MKEPAEYFLLLFLLMLTAAVAIAFVVKFFREGRRVRLYERYVRDGMNRHSLITEADIQQTCVGEHQYYKTQLEEKKRRFSEIGSVIFHYADKENIENLYNDRFKEPVTESVVHETENEFSGEAGVEAGNAGVIKLGSSRAEKNRSRITSTLQAPKISLSQMFSRYQSEAVKNGEVHLGLELMNIEMSELETFQGLLRHLKTRYSITIGQEEEKKARAELLTKAAEKNLERLEKAEGFVLMEGLFYIVNFNENHYKCILTHPISECLQSIHKELVFYVLLEREHIEHAFVEYYRQSVEQYILLRVFGRIFQPLDRSKERWEIGIVPIAVY